MLGRVERSGCDRTSKLESKRKPKSRPFLAKMYPRIYPGIWFIRIAEVRGANPELPGAQLAAATTSKTIFNPPPNKSRCPNY